MNEYLLYMAKVAMLLALFYSGYRLLLSRDTRHKMQRLVLLASVAMAFALPIIVITTTKEVWMNAEVLENAGGKVAPVPVDNRSVRSGDIIPLMLMGIYLAGVLVIAVRTLCSNWKVWQIIRHSRRHGKADCAALCVSASDMAPFTWWRYIVIGSEDICNKAVLNHEIGHVRHRHSLDILLLDMACMLQWFNPFVWMLRRELCTVHEYEADEKVLAQGEDAYDYQMLLLRRAVKSGPMAVVNSLSQSALRQRIAMMQRCTSTRWNYLRLLYVIPIIALSLSMTAETIIHYHYPVIAKEKLEKNLVPTVNDSEDMKPMMVKGDRTSRRTSETIHHDDSVLYVVNGIEKSKFDLGKLNPSDIVSIEVLKAPATSVYKKRAEELGAKGVIVITTYQGKNQKTESKKANDTDTIPVLSGSKMNL